jgi:hypothetical protein
MDEIRRRLAALRPDKDSEWGRMCAPQAVCHLADGFRMVLGERPIEMRGSLPMLTVIRFMALTLSLAWPKGVATVPEIDQERGGTSPSSFQEDVGELQASIGRFVAAAGVGMDTHPIFGNLTRGEWGRAGDRHLDHHLTQFGV